MSPIQHVCPTVNRSTNNVQVLHTHSSVCFHVFSCRTPYYSSTYLLQEVRNPPVEGASSLEVRPLLGLVDRVRLAVSVSMRPANGQHIIGTTTTTTTSRSPKEQRRQYRETQREKRKKKRCQKRGEERAVRCEHVSQQQQQQ